MNTQLRNALVAAGLIATAGTGTAAAAVVVPGTANPWLAGWPDGSTAQVSDSAPAQSPVLAMPVSAGKQLIFSVTGSVNNDPWPSGLGPDGGDGQFHDTENGLAALTAPINSLIGVFLGASQPDPAAPPNAFIYDSADLLFRPGLAQPFFIGDGLSGTGSGQPQRFEAPLGATRLFLGTMDGYDWNNNYGQFEAAVSGVPLPGALVVAASGLALVFGAARRTRSGSGT